MLIGPFWIKTPDTYTDKKKTTVLVPGENRSLVLKPGDGLLYKGCERPHWRDKMPGSNKKKNKKLFGKKTSETELTIIKSSSIMCLLMGKEHTVHGIEHDESTTF